MHACLLSHIQIFATPWTVALQASLSMGFSSQEYWNGLPCLPPWDLPDPGIEPWILDPVSCLLYWQVGSLPLAQPGKPSLLSFRLNFPGKMIYPLIPSSRHSHYSRSPPFCWWWYITKSNWHLLSSFLNFTFIKFSLNDSCFYVPNTVWKDHIPVIPERIVIPWLGGVAKAWILLITEAGITFVLTWPNISPKLYLLPGSLDLVSVYFPSLVL